MKHATVITREKMSRILDELYTYLFTVGAQSIALNIKRWDDGFSISIESDYDPAMRHKIEHLSRFLNPEIRNASLEETYWALVGCDRTGEDSELMLVGQMLDSADVFIYDDRVRLALFKKYE